MNIDRKGILDKAQRYGLCLGASSEHGRKERALGANVGRGSKDWCLRCSSLRVSRILRSGWILRDTSVHAPCPSKHPVRLALLLLPCKTQHKGLALCLQSLERLGKLSSPSADKPAMCRVCGLGGGEQKPVHPVFQLRSCLSWPIS